MNIFGRKNNVKICRANNLLDKNMYINIQNGEAVVSTPWYYTSNKIQEKVNEKKKWILNKIKEFKYNDLSNIKLIKIFGKDYYLNVVYQNIKTAELNLEESKKIIEIVLPNKYKKIGSEHILKMSLEKMYEQIANNEIENIMEKVRLMLGIAPEEYIIVNIKNTLGKCIDGKTIYINPQIVKFNREVIEFVVIHEFCHLKYKTHGKRFYELLSKYVKDYKKYEKFLIDFEY